MVPPIKPANAAAKASDFAVVVIGISLSLVEPRLAARDVRVDCDRIAAEPEELRRKRDSHSQLSHSAALSCELHIGVHVGIKVTVNLRERKRLRLCQSPAVPGSDCLQCFEVKDIWLSTSDPSAVRSDKI